jgi:putative thioredoxin
MLDISIQNFEAELIHGSQQQPVLLDIWAPWCGPCKSLGPVLEKLEVSYAGRFKLAKLNSDDQPDIAGQLSQMFGVRSIPFCVMFKDGQPVDGFVGALPEAEIRKFLDKHVPSPEELAAEEDVHEAEELLAEGNVDSALAKLQEAVAINPGNDAARYDYLRALLNEGRIEEARRAFEPVAGKAVKEPLRRAALPTCRPPLTATSAISRHALNSRNSTSRPSASAKQWTNCSKSSCATRTGATNAPARPTSPFSK